MTKNIKAIMLPFPGGHIDVPWRFVDEGLKLQQEYKSKEISVDAYESGLYELSHKNMVTICDRLEELKNYPLPEEQKNLSWRQTCTQAFIGPVKFDPITSEPREPKNYISVNEMSSDQEGIYYVRWNEYYRMHEIWEFEINEYYSRKN